MCYFSILIDKIRSNILEIKLKVTLQKYDIGMAAKLRPGKVAICFMSALDETNRKLAVKKFQPEEISAMNQTLT